MKLTLIGAAALAATTLTLPASAQQVISNPGYCAQFYPNANCQNNGDNSPYNGSYQGRGGTSGQLGFNNPEWNGGIANDGFERRARRGRYTENGGYRRMY